MAMPMMLLRCLAPPQKPSVVTLTPVGMPQTLPSDAAETLCGYAMHGLKPILYVVVPQNVA